ncbi:MAG TPA: ATP-binding protein [Symbiobacteriaceae bacterium]|nr:ATP-binding protein [Symbiobacteriaceae bacterium]
MHSKLLLFRHASRPVRYGTMTALVVLRVGAEYFMPGSVLSSALSSLVVLSSAVALRYRPALVLAAASSLLPYLLHGLNSPLALPAALLMVGLRLAMSLLMSHMVSAMYSKTELLEAVALSTRARITLVDAAGKVVFVSRPTALGYGREPHQLEGADFRSFLPAWFMPTAEELFASVMDGRNSSVQTPFLVIKQGGKSVPVVVHVRPIDYMGERYALAKVHEVTDADISQSLFMNGLDSTDIAIAVRTPDARIIWCNQQFAHAAGRMKAELIGSTVAPFNSPGFNIVDAVEALKAGPGLWEHKLQDGRIMRVRGYPIFDANGSMKATISFSQDVTEQYEVESRVRQAERLAAVGQLAAGIAHNFNNVLAAISANTELLRLQCDNADDTAAENILRAVEHGSSMVTKLYELAGRHEAPRLEAVAVDAVFGSVLQVVAGQIRQAGVTVAIAVPGGTSVQADAEQLKQVLMNLVLNSLQAMPTGGKLSLSACATGGDMEIQVGDTGCGIPPEHMELIFQPFFTTKGALNGTGLGLPTSRTMVRAMGGDMTVSSVPGEGTTVTVRLSIGRDVKKAPVA